MFILTISHFFENFESKEDKISPSDWDFTTNIIPFEKKEDACRFLEVLKVEYGSKEEVSTGEISGHKIKMTEFGETVETIHTELTELEFGEELEVAVLMHQGYKR